MRAVIGSACTLLAAAAVTVPGPAAAASNSAVTTVPLADGTQLEMHTSAECSGGSCRFNTAANILTADGPIGFPGDFWGRQTIYVRSNNANVWQEVSYSAPSGMPPETKGANHDNVLSKQLKSLNNAEISITYFGGGPLERFRVDGTSTPLNWDTGQPDTTADFIVCSSIQVVFGGNNLNSPTACAQTRF